MVTSSIPRDSLWKFKSQLMPLKMAARALPTGSSDEPCCEYDKTEAAAVTAPCDNSCSWSLQVLLMALCALLVATHCWKVKEDSLLYQWKKNLLPLYQGTNFSPDIAGKSPWYRWKNSLAEQVFLTVHELLAALTLLFTKSVLSMLSDFNSANVSLLQDICLLDDGQLGERVQGSAQAGQPRPPSAHLT